MALYAIDNVDDAFDVTRAFLASIGRWTWLKLAVVVLFVGGFGGGFPGFFPGTGGGTDTGAPPGEEFPVVEPGPDFWLVVAGVVVAAVVLALALALVGSILEFVFVESLRTEAVSIREYWGRHWRKGVRLFAFRLVVVGFLLAVFLLFGGLFVAPFLFDTGAVGVSLLLLLVLFPVFLVVAVLVGLFNGFTTTFVVPIMILEDRGVLAGWRRLWPTIRTQWKQYLAYAVAAWVLSFAGSIVVFLLAAVLAVVLLVPFGVLFGIGLGLLSVAETVGIAWLVVTGVLFAVAGVFALALAQAPVVTYLRYYGLLVLGDVEVDFDVVPDQRAAVREPDES